MAHRSIYRILDAKGKEWISIGGVSMGNKRKPWSIEEFHKALKKRPETATTRYMVFDEKGYRRYAVSRESLENLPITQLIEAGKNGHR